MPDQSTQPDDRLVQITIRSTADQRKLWNEAAQQKGKSLQQWAFDALQTLAAEAAHESTGQRRTGGLADG